jgi:hypothetical protein
MTRAHDRWDMRALLGSASLLLLATLVLAAATLVVGRDSWNTLSLRTVFVAVSAAGLVAGTALAIFSWREVRRGQVLSAVGALLMAYCSLLVGPASQIYRVVDTWQDLASVGRDIQHDSIGREMILFVADETTRALIDMYTRTSAIVIPAPLTAKSAVALKNTLADHPQGVVVALLPGRSESPTLRALRAKLRGRSSAAAEAPVDGASPSWVAQSHLHATHVYTLPNGRRYALFELDNASR